MKKVNAFEEAFVDKGIAIGEKRGFENGRKEVLQNLKINLLETDLCKTKDEAAEMAAKLLKKTKQN